MQFFPILFACAIIIRWRTGLAGQGSGMANFELDVENQRVMTKVARLYHSRGVRQTEIASRLGISQARVSRLLRAAEEAEIVRDRKSVV